MQEKEAFINYQSIVPPDFTLDHNWEHVKALNERFEGYPERVGVPPHTTWENVGSSYNPPDYTSEEIVRKFNDGVESVDPEDASIVSHEFVSYEGAVGFSDNGRPLNPKGPTGISGRGILYRWGANFAADPIITRIGVSGKIEMITVLRSDGGGWAIPGGMVDKGERVTETLKRELSEETFANIDFDNATFIYSGYVDDPRNTDNAWMETDVFHIHLTDAGNIQLKPGDDTKKAEWKTINQEFLDTLYASHARSVLGAIKNWQDEMELIVTPDGTVKKIFNSKDLGATEVNGDEEIEFRKKLFSVGLTEQDYEEAITAIELCDTDLLQTINRLAESRIDAQSSVAAPITTQSMYRIPSSGEYVSWRYEMHRDVIEEILAPVEKQESPRFHIMAGLPGVGKTAGLYLFQYSQNAVLTDPTLIQKRITPDFDESNYTQVLATKDESFDIAEKLIDEAFNRGLAITSESTLQNLPWATRALMEATKRGYESHIIFFHRKLADCFRDAIEHRKRPVSINYLLKSLQGYENLLYFDSLPGVRVTVVDKTDPDNWKTIYDGSDGTLDQNDEFEKIRKTLDVFRALAIKKA